MTAEAHAASACMHNACMPNITIRDVPADVHAVLQQRAAAAGQSMQQYLLSLLRHQASEQDTRESTRDWLARAAERARGRQSNLRGVDVVALIHEGREERTRQILGLREGDSE